MKTFPIVITLLFLALCTSAQTQIAVQNPSGPLFFTTLETAIQQAEPEATVYLPGGVFSITNLTIDKKIRIVGIGHKPASNPNGAYTRVVGNINLRQGSNGSKLEGLYLAGAISIGNSLDTIPVADISLIRCHIIDHALQLSVGSHASTGNLISECITEGINGGNTEELLVMKSIIKKDIVSVTKQSTFRNNIFLDDQSEFTFQNVSNATFENNIFLCQYSNISNSTLSNNIFQDGFDYNFAASSNNVSSNFTGVLLEDIFMNVPSKVFKYEYNYQLKSTSVGIASGTDNKDLGIYGTSIPFKDAATPDVPHIDNINIGSTTDNQGRLSISVKVSAQGN